MSSFDRLHPTIQHHVVNTMGWRELRPLQLASIEPIIDGSHALLIAPTAGGKTEAAFLPLLSRMVTEDWRGLGIIYVCPLKALLNNLHARLERYCQWVGRTCAVWHGDVLDGQRKAILREMPDCLLTTPESLEAILVSSRIDHRKVFSSARAVVVDEIHAFAGDDRGWHLLAVLERVTRLSGREIQRVGLSATVGNPDILLDWLAGHCEGRRQLVQIEASKTARAPEVTVDFVGSIENAASVIAALHRGEKRLVFCDSRSRVEQLATLLRAAGVEIHVSHSSLSAEERRRAEQAFAEANNCVIVATSTLELGIDVGDLDRVMLPAEEALPLKPVLDEIRVSAHLLGLDLFSRYAQYPAGQPVFRITTKYGIWAEGWGECRGGINGFLVRAGSMMAKNVKGSLRASTCRYYDRRKLLLAADGPVRELNGEFRFLRDTWFSSAHQAASIVLGQAASETKTWEVVKDIVPFYRYRACLRPSMFLLPVRI